MTYRIKKQVVLWFITCFTPLGLASSKALVLSTIADAKTSPATYVDVGKKGDSLGDQYVFDQPLLDSQGHVIGSNSGFCLRTKLQHSLQCQWTLTFSDGTIQVAGREFDEGVSDIPIVGGTGKYQGITGQMRSFKNAEGTFTQQLNYWLAVKKH